MVRQSNDGSGTPLSLWFRAQAADLPSKKEDLPHWCNWHTEPLFTNHNLDYVWVCYQGPHKNKWMVFEEKRHNSNMAFAQAEAFKIVEAVCYADSYFKGFHLIKLENTSPDDGRMWIDGKEMNVETFVSFLQFELPDCYYGTYFEETPSSTKEILISQCKRLASLIQGVTA